MKNLFSIGELSKLFDISIRTLRYYDEIGLLKPEFINNETNYRYYSTKQFERLNTIKYLRALDMPIVQIISFFENKDVDKMIQILDEQKKTVISMKKELELIEKKIENRLNQLIDANNTEYNKINIKHIKKREIIVIRKDISIFEDLEHPIRDLEKISSLKAPIFLGKIGVSISADKIKKDIYEEFSSIFIILEEEDFYKGKVETLEESLYATIRFQGTHRDSRKFYKNLKKFIKDENCQITNDSIEITIIDSGITNSNSKFVTELQIPIKYSEK
jgi:DNA-binding transcriptional MerR regulator